MAKAGPYTNLKKNIKILKYVHNIVEESYLNTDLYKGPSPGPGDCDIAYVRTDGFVPLSKEDQQFLDTAPRKIWTDLKQTDIAKDRLLKLREALDEANKKAVDFTQTESTRYKGVSRTGYNRDVKKIELAIDLGEEIILNSKQSDKGSVGKRKSPKEREKPLLYKWILQKYEEDNRRRERREFCEDMSREWGKLLDEKKFCPELAKEYNTTITIKILERARSWKRQKENRNQKL